MTLPTAVNDALREMMGECRHEWVLDHSRGFSRHLCTKCGLDWWHDDPDIPERPSIGQGLPVSLGEMVRLALSKGCCLHFDLDCLNVWPPTPGSFPVCHDFDLAKPGSLEYGLARALLAAAGREAE